MPLGPANASRTGSIPLALQKELEKQGLQAQRVLSSDLALAMDQAVDCPLLAGYYDARGRYFGYIYNTRERTLVDAFNSQELLGDLPGIEPETEEDLRQKFVTGLVRRLKSNPRLRKRHDNLYELYQMSPAYGRIPAWAHEESTIEEALGEFQKNVQVASNVEASLQRQPASVSVVTRRQIEMSGARTVNELLMLYVPGMFVTEDQDDTIAAFRGLAPDSNAKVLMLINGQKINTEWQFGPPDSLINGLAMDHIERIELIRGPGSNTHGQGALLGVINIILRNEKTSGAVLKGSAGQDQFNGFSVLASQRGEEISSLHSTFFLSRTGYNGQALREEGWAKDRGYDGAEGYMYRIEPGLKEPADCAAKSDRAFIFSEDCYYRNVSVSGSRLKKAEHLLAMGQMQYGEGQLTTLYSDQVRDNYNFYRDRNEIHQILGMVSGSYKYQLRERASLEARSYYARDDFMFQSHGGSMMAGVRENRYGGALVGRLASSRNRNRLAVGAELNRYDMGQDDINGNNFIVNRRSDDLLDDPNLRRKFVYTDSLIIHSFFLEDFFRLTPDFEIFGGLRYDEHPFWGSNLSPRAGFFFNPLSSLQFRLSYQEGFRGAAGVAYVGGYQGDGLLRARNYNQVALARIPATDEFGTRYERSNISDLRPEKIRSGELALNYSAGRNWELEGIFFYNLLENVIDVGVLYADPAVFEMPAIGNDIPGDWNGYWFYRNLPGIIRQGGVEAGVQYHNRFLQLGISHALVRVLSASDSMYFEEYKGGMYLTSDRENKHFKAYPENQTRINLSWQMPHGFALAINYLYYLNWYSPVGERIEGNQIATGTLSYAPDEDMVISLTGKNLLAAGNLYPMNSNAGDKVVSRGSPALEERTWWASVKMTLR